MGFRVTVEVLMLVLMLMLVLVLVLMRMGMQVRRRVLVLMEYFVATEALIDVVCSRYVTLKVLIG